MLQTNLAKGVLVYSCTTTFRSGQHTKVLSTRARRSFRGSKYHNLIQRYRIQFPVRQTQGNEEWVNSTNLWNFPVHTETMHSNTCTPKHTHIREYAPGALVYTWTREVKLTTYNLLYIHYWYVMYLCISIVRKMLLVCIWGFNTFATAPLLPPLTFLSTCSEFIVYCIGQAHELFEYRAFPTAFFLNLSGHAQCACIRVPVQLY